MSSTLLALNTTSRTAIRIANGRSCGKHQPVYRYEGHCAEPVWAITKHAAGSFADQALRSKNFRTHRVGRYRNPRPHDSPGRIRLSLYPSANRDEEVFEEPFKFDISRNPNPHIGFGIGEHFCLGANLAGLELEVVFLELARRLEYAEPAGPPERLRSNFVGSIKHMPI